MTTWYSKVKTFGRDGQHSYKRKVTLEGELDDIRVAAAMIAGWFDEKDDVKEEISEAGSVEAWLDSEAPYWAKDITDTEKASIFDEEWSSGIGKTKEIALQEFDKADESVEDEPSDWDESLQIPPRADLVEVDKQRRSSRPLKGHAEVAQKFLEVRRAIDEIDQQAAALRAIIGEKERVAGNLAGEPMKYAEEYEDRTFKTKEILLTLQDIPPHTAKVPQWRKVIDHLLDKLGSVSADMRAEAEEFIESAKSEIPGRTELMYQELESSVMGEAWTVVRKLLDKAKAVGRKTKDKLSEIENETKAFLAQMEPDQPWKF